MLLKLFLVKMTSITLTNKRFTDGTIGPDTEMLGPVNDGAIIKFETAPCCWGPMITPRIKSGHEVNLPVYIKNAKKGDALVIKIKKIKVNSLASSSGVHQVIPQRHSGDPSSLAICQNCGTKYPDTVVKGVGLDAIKCVNCGASVSPFMMRSGYTMIFDAKRTVGITTDLALSKNIAENASEWAKLPKNSQQISSLISNRADIPGLTTRVIPFLGHVGTTPSVRIPANKNAGDVACSLVDAENEFSISKHEYETSITDAHLDIDTVKEGSTLICPVKVKGGGLYVGDMHAQQGDGEIAGHTTDISGEVILEVHLIKGIQLDSPLLIPNTNDLPPLSKPFNQQERSQIKSLSDEYELQLEHNSPIQVIGSGPNLNDAVNDSVTKAGLYFQMDIDEIKNRITLTGGIEIGRLPGIVHTSMKIPNENLEKLNILKYI